MRKLTNKVGSAHVRIVEGLSQAEEEIAYLEFNLERTKKELGRWTLGDLSGVKLTSESDGAKLEEHIKAIEYELAHKQNDLHDLKRLICTFSGLEYKILYRKYVVVKTIEKMTEEIGYSPRYI
ncbi:hypothetical protein ACQKII_24390 [Lysinibacillus sp. NPDC048646]|uniref:hypothetical protein n=1 Tax=Lysinibacillus sp. NPDC048646 TaxID=3390574 RepID=UPI003D0533B9